MSRVVFRLALELLRVASLRIFKCTADQPSSSRGQRDQYITISAPLKVPKRQGKALAMGREYLVHDGPRLKEDQPPGLRVKQNLVLQQDSPYLS